MKTRKLITLVFLLVYIQLLPGTASGCNVSDEAAIASAKSFCKKVGISFSREPSVTGVNESIIDGSSLTKQIEFGEKGNSKGSINVSCVTKDVQYYFNSELRDYVRKKYKIPSVTSEPHNWPPFLSEDKAKKIMFSVAKRIGLPPDVEFSQLSIDKENGKMSGKWVRKHNGYPYAGDGIRVEIMAVDGEFVFYSKNYSGKPCPTEIKVSKKEAIKESWRQIERLFGESSGWNRHEDDYEIKSAELKIIQPNVLDGRMVSRRSTESRLAWVIEYKLKNRGRREDSLLSITIKIDAGTKKFLGGKHSR